MTQIDRQITALRRGYGLDRPVTIDYPLACLKRAAENEYPWSVTPGEAAALVAEVERLRDLVRHQRGPSSMRASSRTRNMRPSLRTTAPWRGWKPTMPCVWRTSGCVRAQKLRRQIVKSFTSGSRAGACPPSRTDPPTKTPSSAWMQLARLRDAVTRDRAALVEWLRFAPQCYTDGYLLVGPIERGEHRKENP